MAVAHGLANFALGVADEDGAWGGADVDGFGLAGGFNGDDAAAVFSGAADFEIGVGDAFVADGLDHGGMIPNH